MLLDDLSVVVSLHQEAKGESAWVALGEDLGGSAGVRVQDSVERKAGSLDGVLVHCFDLLIIYQFRH